MSAQSAPAVFSLERRNAESAGSIDEVVPLGHHAMEGVVALGQPIYVRGWAVDAIAKKLASRVAIVVDGVLEFSASYGTARADIANTFGVPDYSRAGFDVTLPPVLGLGAHNVVACAVSADGRSYVPVATAPFHVIPSLIPRPFTQVPGERAEGEILAASTDGDNRTAEQRAGRIELGFDAGVTVRGWAKLSRGPYDEVGIVVDDRWYLEGNRTGVSATGAYEARFVLNFALPGDHELYAVARASRGAFVRVSERHTFESIEPPLPWLWPLVELRQPTRAGIDEVLVSSGSLHALPRGNAIFVRGWAIDEPAGGPAAGVYISLDGNRIAAVPARYERPHETEGASARCGFTASIPTDALARGPHRFELLVAARAWTGYYVPTPPVSFNVVERPVRPLDSEAKRVLSP